ncbi:MAG: cytochrome C oxidase Cbb3 [Eggerthellaceae bacterium]|jgi:hypothetical protein
MSGMFETLADIFHDFWTLLQRNKRVVRHVLTCAAVILALGALVEVFVFNFNYFASLGYKPINLTYELQGQLPKSMNNKEYRLTTVNNSIEFSGLNTEVHNIHIQFDSSESAQVVSATIHFTDEAHQTYFDSNEYSVGIPTAKIATNGTESQYLNLNASGKVQNLKIEFSGDENLTYPITIIKVEINAHCPFTFQFMRYLLLVAVMALVYVFRPKSAIYRWHVNAERTRMNALIAVAVTIEVLALSTFLLYGSNLVGVATSSYNYGSWDKHSLANTYEVGGKNAQQYAELAKSMTEGHLYLDETPPDWLVQMDDPYDKGARDELQKHTGEDYLFDVAYYDGHYYVYFGVVPVLIYYLPFYLITGSTFPTAIGVLISGLFFVIGTTLLLLLFARRHFKKVSLGLFLLLQISLIMCSGMLYLFKLPTFYALPIMTGLAFSVWGLYFWMRGRSLDKPCGCYLAGSLCMALVLGCRPQLMVLSLIAFPLFWRRYITNRRIMKREGQKELCCLLGPYVVVFAGIFAYNYARFGSFTNFGANYNLTMNDMTKRGFSVGRLAPALFAYFLQAPNMVGEFPYLQAVDFQTTYLGQTIRENTYGGLLACIPLLWVLFFSVPVLKMRIRTRQTHTVAGVAAIMIVMGIVVACMDAEMAGILQRYFADFSFLFLAAAALIVFIVNENITHGTQMANILLKVLIALVTLSVLYSVLLCLVAEVGWISDVYPWAYQNLLEMFEFWS